MIQLQLLQTIITTQFLYIYSLYTILLLLYYNFHKF